MSLKEHGANSLRGGRRAFGCATLVGNYVEERHSAQDSPVAWCSTIYGSYSDKTTAHEQMMQGARKFPKRFGARLIPSESSFVNRIGANNSSKQITAWKSIPHSVRANTGIPTEYAPKNGMRGGIISLS